MNKLQNLLKRRLHKSCNNGGILEILLTIVFIGFLQLSLVYHFETKFNSILCIMLIFSFEKDKSTNHVFSLVSKFGPWPFSLSEF